MGPKSLTITPKNNHPYSQVESPELEMKPKAESSRDHDETETTLPEEDEDKYGYNEHDDVEPGSSEATGRPIFRPSRTCSPAPPFMEVGGDFGNLSSISPIVSPRTPRRSSLKGSSGSTPRRQFRRHSLTFSNNVTVATITPTQEMAKKKSLWFEAKDYAKMHTKIHLIAEKAKEGDGRKYCTRGLEKIMRRETLETRKYAAWDAVLDEQEFQRSVGVDDDDALSNSYREVCAESREEATLRALKDEKAVAAYLSETRKYCRRMSM